MPDAGDSRANAAGAARNQRHLTVEATISHSRFRELWRMLPMKAGRLLVHPGGGKQFSLPVQLSNEADAGWRAIGPEAIRQRQRRVARQIGDRQTLPAKQGDTSKSMSRISSSISCIKCMRKRLA